VSSFLGACVIAVFVAQFVGALLYNFTPLHRAYENRLLASGLSPAPAGQLGATRLVTLREGTDVEALARRHGVEGVTAADPTSLRRMHGKLMQVLAGSGARVVAFDISFADPTDHDGAFVEGVQALRAKLIDVVVVTKRMMPGADGNPLLSPTIAKHVKWGGDGAALDGSAAWVLLLFAQVPDSPEPLPGFALATLAAYRQPGADLAIYVDALANRTELRYVKRSTSEVLPSGDVLRTTVSDPDFGLPTGTLQSEFLLNVPHKEVISASDFDYADVLGADQEQLKKWFAGRAVVVGDRRPEGGDGPFHHRDEGPLPGCYAQAVGIDALIGRQGVVVLDTSFPQGLLIACAAALAGALAALLARGSGRTLVIFVIGLAVAAVAGSCVAYAGARYLYNPLVPILAMVAAAVLAAAATSFRRRVLG
jgi:CHASE2 domain-containing sensor protein